MKINDFVEECKILKVNRIPNDGIKYLVIGESPPKSMEYFYKPTNLRYNSRRIPAQVFRAFFNKNVVEKKEYEKLLDKLQYEINFYLDDLSEYPLNDYDSNVRAEAIINCQKAFFSRFEKLNKDENCQKVLVLPKGTIDELQGQTHINNWNGILNKIGVTKNEICIFSKLEVYISKNWISNKLA